LSQKLKKVHRNQEKQNKAKGGKDPSINPENDDTYFTPVRSNKEVPTKNNKNIKIKDQDRELKESVQKAKEFLKGIQKNKELLADKEKIEEKEEEKLVHHEVDDKPISDMVEKYQNLMKRENNEKITNENLNEKASNNPNETEGKVKNDENIKEIKLSAVVSDKTEQVNQFNKPDIKEEKKKPIKIEEQKEEIQEEKKKDETEVISKKNSEKVESKENRRTNQKEETKVAEIPKDKLEKVADNNQKQPSGRKNEKLFGAKAEQSSKETPDSITKGTNIEYATQNSKPKKKQNYEYEDYII